MFADSGIDTRNSNALKNKSLILGPQCILGNTEHLRLTITKNVFRGIEDILAITAHRDNWKPAKLLRLPL